MKIRLFVLLAAIAAVMMFSSTSPAQIKCVEDGVIKRVTKAAAGNFETVTFEVLIKKPDFKVSNAKPPFQEYGSEQRVRIVGPYYKSIVLRGINWECTIGEKFAAKTSNIKAVKSIEQFEGQVEYIIGYSIKGSYVGQTVTRTKKGSLVVLKFRK